MLIDLLRQKKEAIHERWLERTLATYRPDTAAFFRQQADPFANPVGQTLERGTRAILDELLGDLDPGRVCSSLDDILKIRAIQDFTPSQAVSFVFMLKQAIVDELPGELQDPAIAQELLAFETRIDQLVLFALDVYTNSREKVYELRLGEIRRGARRSLEGSGPEPPRVVWRRGESGAG
jgi:hypothetical protein